MIRVKVRTILEVAKDSIGGAGFGIKYLFDEVPAGADALGPDNKLIFASGPFSGTTIPCASRMAVTGLTYTPDDILQVGERI